MSYALLKSEHIYDPCLCCFHPKLLNSSARHHESNWPPNIIPVNMLFQTPNHLSHPDRAVRARFAKHTINTVVPHILLNNPRAKAGSESTTRIYYNAETTRDRPRATTSVRSHSEGKQKTKSGKITGYFKPLNQKKDVTPTKEEIEKNAASASSTAVPIDLKIADSDKDTEKENTASIVTKANSRPKITVIKSDTLDAAQLFVDPKAKDRRIAVLNMASFLRPGGGVLKGAVAQEESLCLRSTLYTALDERFYRLPKFGGLFTKDILVRDQKGSS